MKVLISYSRRDTSLANSLKLALETYNVIVWMDEHYMYFRNDLEDKLRNQILASDYVLPIITPKSYHAAWVDWEMEFASRLEKIENKEKFFPILMSGTKMPPKWAGKPFGDFHTASYMEQNFRILIEKLLKSIPEHEVFTPKEQRLDMEKINTDFFSDANLIAIKSPMVGEFYRSRGPDKPPFVKVGDLVEDGDTVCIIEAMKLFNEIESDVKGKIAKVLVEDASPVEYDQVLFLLEPV